ncbi:hypothetical protein ACPW96_02845 [Micromonospora sp. DT81.3]|uniref:hypothetical protein n=1 Tax=Micromonospora sp. DT81.3 TaxID=3416523 RepID=UPI003CF6D315
MKLFEGGSAVEELPGVDAALEREREAHGIAEHELRSGPMISSQIAGFLLAMIAIRLL